MMSNNEKKYDEMIAAAAAEYMVAAAASREAHVAAAVAREEVAGYERELEELRGQLRGFERGELVLPVEQFHELSDRERWLVIRLKGSRGVAAQLGEQAAAAGRGVANVGGTWRGRLRQLVMEDVRAFEASKLAALEAVLRG